MKTCYYCQKLFTPSPGSTGTYCSLSCSSKRNGKVKHKKSIEAYESSPCLCKNCSKPIEYLRRKSNKFCGRTCAAIYNNSKKDWDKIVTGPKPKTPKPKAPRKRRSTLLPDASGPHTRVYLCTCKITGKKWYSPTIKTIHPTTILDKKTYAYQCRFQFSLSSYPQWFSNVSSLISEYGWYSASNRGNNLNGCSRDHLFSVSDGFINKVDPTIISHPANCQVVPHRHNQSKNKKSSISLNELLLRIEQFNRMCLESATGIQPA